MATLISEKADFKTRSITKEKEQCFIMKSSSSHKEDTIILNLCVPNNTAQNTWDKSWQLKGEMDKATIRDGNFYIPPSVTDIRQR